MPKQFWETKSKLKYNWVSVKEKTTCTDAGGLRHLGMQLALVSPLKNSHGSNVFGFLLSGNLFQCANRAALFILSAYYRVGMPAVALAVDAQAILALALHLALPSSKRYICSWRQIVGLERQQLLALA